VAWGCKRLRKRRSRIFWDVIEVRDRAVVWRGRTVKSRLFICLSHERTWGILFKSRYTNVRIIIIIIIINKLCLRYYFRPKLPDLPGNLRTMFGPSVFHLGPLHPDRLRDSHRSLPIIGAENSVLDFRILCSTSKHGQLKATAWVKYIYFSKQTKHIIRT